MKLANGIGEVPSSLPIYSLPRNLSRPHHFSRLFLYLLLVMELLFFPTPGPIYGGEYHGPLLHHFGLTSHVVKSLVFFKIGRSHRWCGRLPWLWWEGQQLPWLL